jgi:hypothetical protein
MVSKTLYRYAPHIPFGFVPCDLRSPVLLRESLGICDLIAITIYDAWGEEKKTVIEDAGYDVKVLWQRKEKIISSTEIRRRLSHGLDYGHLVPSGTADIIRSSTVEEP